MKNGEFTEDKKREENVYILNLSNTKWYEKQNKNKSRYKKDIK